MRILFSTIVCLALVLVIGCADQGVPQAQADKVKVGMTLNEIEAIVGKDRESGSANMLEWGNEKGKLQVTLNNGKAMAVKYSQAGPEKKPTE